MKEEKATQIRNPSLQSSQKSNPKPLIGPKRTQISLGAKIRETLKKWRRTVQKLKRGSHLKTSIPTNWSTSPGPVDHLVNTVNDLIFQFFCAFPRFVIPLPFSVEIHNFFMPNAKGVLIFGRNLTII